MKMGYSTHLEACPSIKNELVVKTEVQVHVMTQARLHHSSKHFTTHSSKPNLFAMSSPTCLMALGNQNNVSDDSNEDEESLLNSSMNNKGNYVTKNKILKGFWF